jgi:hypothetical protein
MKEANLDILVDRQLEDVRMKCGESISQEEAYRLAKNLANEMLEEVNNMKADFEFTVSSGREPNQYTAGVKVREVSPDIYHISGYWDMPHAIENLGTPVIKHELTTERGKLPHGIMEEVQNILFVGVETMQEQGIRVSQSELRRVHNMVKQKKNNNGN